MVTLEFNFLGKIRKHREKLQETDTDTKEAESVCHVFKNCIRWDHE